MARQTPAKRPQPDRYQHPLVARLRHYARVFGDFERPLLEAAHRVNLQASMDDATMYARVMEAIAKGCNHIDDIAEEAKGVPFADVRRIYDQLLIEGAYEERPIGVKTDESRGRRPRGIFLKSALPGNLPPGVIGRRRYGQYFNNAKDDDDDKHERKDEEADNRTSPAPADR